MNEAKHPTRRELLKSLGTVIAAATLARARTLGLAPGLSGIKVPVPGVTAAGTANLHFFSPDEKEAVAVVADLMIPTDEVSPGARAAGVHNWIDFVVANSPRAVQQQWREGLAALDRTSEDTAGKKLLALDAFARRRLLEMCAQHENAPSTPAERFFALAKEATVNGYYTSEIGLMQDLKYQGATYVDGPEVSCPAHTPPAPANKR